MDECFDKIKGKIPKELIDKMHEKENRFKKWSFVTFIVNILIAILAIAFTKYGFRWIVPWISLLLGIVGTFIVGHANLSSAKSIMGYSLTLVSYNSCAVDMLSDAKLWSTVGTICIIFSLLLNNFASIWNN